MLKSTEGIVVRTVKYGETSVILDLLTPEDGIRSFIMGGVRKRKKGNVASKVQVLNLVTIQAYIKNNDRLSRIKELSYNYIYKSIPFDVVKSSIAIFLIEVCRKTVKASSDSHALYQFVVKGLIHLDNLNSGIAHFHIGFLLDLGRHLGFEITNNYGDSSPYFSIKEGSFVNARDNYPLSLSKEVSFHLSKYLVDQDYRDTNRMDRKEIIITLIDFYKYHLDDFGDIKSLEVLMSIYDDP